MKKRNFLHRTQKKRYKAGKFKNPYFDKNSKKIFSLVFPIIGAFTGLIILIVILFTHTNLNITNVEINGIKFIDKQIIKKEINSYLNNNYLFVFKKRNVFLFNKNELVKRLKSKFIFDELFIDLHKKQITIHLTERTSQLLWTTNDIIYVVDLNGVVVRELSAVELEILDTEISDPSIITKDKRRLDELPIFLDKNNLKINIGDSVLKETEIVSIIEFHKHLKNQGIEFTNTNIDRLAGKWIGVKTKDGYDILFDATADINNQAMNLKTILQEKIDDKSKLNYIDLRFGDHVYFK